MGIYRGEELAIEALRPNEDEIEDVFALTIEQLLDEKHILHRAYQPKNPDAKPLTLKVFSAGPHEVWGLTAYILDRFLDEILIPLSKNTRL